MRTHGPPSGGSRADNHAPKGSFYEKLESKVENFFHGGGKSTHSSKSPHDSRPPSGSPNTSSSHSGGRKRQESSGFDSDARTEGSYGRTSHSSGGGGGGNGKWGSKNLSGMVMLSVEVTGGSEFPKRIAVKKDKVNVTAFDISAPDSTKIRIFTASVTELVRELSSEFADCSCFFRSLPDKHEPLGPIKDLRSGKIKVSVQLTPSLEIDNVYSAALVLNKDSKGKPGKGKDEHDNFKIHEKSSSGAKRPGGPLSRLDDMDRESDSGSYASDASQRRGRRNPSSTGSHRPSTSKQNGGHYDNLEVVGTSYSKNHGKSDKPDAGRSSSKMSRQSSFQLDEDDNYNKHSPKKGSSEKSGWGDSSSQDQRPAWGSGNSRQDSFYHEDHSRKPSPSRKSDSFAGESHSRKPSPSRQSKGEHDKYHDENHSRKSSTHRKESGGAGKDNSDDEWRMAESHSRKPSPSRKEHGQEDKHGKDSHSRKSSPDRKSSSSSHGDSKKKVDNFFESFDDDEDENDFKKSSSPKHKTRSLHGDQKKSYTDDKVEHGGDRGLRPGSKRPSGDIVGPSNPPPIKNDVPREELVLEYVHGYRMRDVNNNAYYLAPGIITFPAGSVGVVMDIRSNKQRFFQGRHKEDVTAITVHPLKEVVATGDIDTSRQISIRVGEKKLAKGIADLQFSPDGEYLVAVAMDTDHTVYLYEWKKGGKLLATQKGNQNEIFGITFNPRNPLEFVTYGVKHLTIWTYDPTSKKLKSERGTVSTGTKKATSIICCTYFPNNTFVTGTYSGDLLFWSRSEVTNVMEQVHSGSVFSVYFDKNIGLISGGKDGMVLVHDPRSLDTLDKLQLPSGVRSVDIGPDGAALIGLEDSILVEVKGLGERGREKKLTKILEGHSAQKGEELWGCATDPNDSDVFATSGDDSMVFMRSISSRKTLGATRLQGKLRAITFSPDSKLLAVGNFEGDFFILKTSNLSQIHFEKRKKMKGINTKEHSIEVIRFSPDGRYLAVAGHDMVVHVHEVAKDFPHIATCKGHSSFITHMDWSADSSFIQTNSGDYDLLFWSMPNGKRIGSATAMRDVKWATWTCIKGWPVQGIWESGMNGDDINAADRHPGHSCIASGDDNMNVRLHSYPAAKPGMPGKKYPGHGSHVTKVRFTSRGDRLISTGGMDGCTFLWRVEGGNGGGHGGGGASRHERRRSDDYSDAESGDGYESR
ncbi:hypothetical protein BC829DRAFT_396745 [Chytridium lagenaria]|nr:hypothetical protein BC829DRAFT_396745 [Chytridium lagenaria]